MYKAGISVFQENCDVIKPFFYSFFLPGSGNVIEECLGDYSQDPKFQKENKPSVRKAKKYFKRCIKMWTG